MEFIIGFISFILLILGKEIIKNYELYGDKKVHGKILILIGLSLLVYGLGGIVKEYYVILTI